MDATMACLVCFKNFLNRWPNYDLFNGFFQFTWLEGHSLAQTIFTNLYTHKPYEIEDRVLKAFIVGVLKLTATCGDVIRRAYVCEEVSVFLSTWLVYDCISLRLLFSKTELFAFLGRFPTNHVRLPIRRRSERNTSHWNVERSGRGLSKDYSGMLYFFFIYLRIHNPSNF